MNTNLGTILQFTLFLNIQRQYVDSLSYYPDRYTSKIIGTPRPPIFWKIILVPYHFLPLSTK